MGFEVIGLAIIAMAWIMQALYMSKGDKSINGMFIVIYVLGVLVLVTDGYIDEDRNIMAFNLLTAAAALAVTMRVLAMKRK